MHPTIRTTAEALRQGRLNSVELLQQCLARIDSHEPHIRAWVVVDADRAMGQARQADSELKSGHDRGLLHGIPVGVKDIIDVFDLPTACGSKLWQNSVARQDAPCVTRLRQAGAVIVGKTATTAYASFDPAPTRNPWHPERTPGGSSSGSAAAVAAGMCLAALATQTGGSITRPASFCGVASCKPSYGAVSAEGVLPLAYSMDHVGAMASCVDDVAIVMRALFDPIYRSYPPATQATPFLGRLRGFFDRHADESVRAMMDEVCARLAGEGAVILDVEPPPAFEEVAQRHHAVMCTEAAVYHQERMARHPDDYPPNIARLVNQGIALPAPEYARARRQQLPLRGDFEAILQGLDALLCPATTRSAPERATTGDPLFNSPWSYTGLPVVSFPVQLGPDGLPLAVQLVGGHGEDGQLFETAQWCEGKAGPGLGSPPE